MLTVAKLLDAMQGLDPHAGVIVGIMNGPRFNAAYANPEAGANDMHLYICCYDEPRQWEGTPLPTISEDGTSTLRYRPGED